MTLVAPTALGPSPDGPRVDICPFYRLGPEVDMLASTLLESLELSERGAAVIVTDGGPLGSGLERIARQDGLPIPVVSLRDPDWLHGVRDSGAVVVLCDADPVAAGETVAALRLAGWQGTFLGGPELAASDFVAVAGQAAEGAVFVTPWPFPADVPAAADFTAAYQSVSNGLPPGPLAASAYEATWVLLEALQRNITERGVPTRAGIAAALPATAREGMLGLITFDVDRGWAAAPLYRYRIDSHGQPQRVP